MARQSATHASAAFLVLLLGGGIAAVNAADPGAGMQPGANGPEPCPAGTAKHGTGPFKCGLCTGNRFQPDTGATACRTCVNGNATSDHRACEPNAGYEPGSDGNPTPCKAGTAKAGPGFFKCGLCSGQRFQPKSGQTTCLACTNGNATADHRACTPDAGYEPSSSGVPSACQAGYAKTSPGFYKCVLCAGTFPNGGGQKFQPGTASTSCYECFPGGTVNAARTSCSINAANAPPAPATGACTNGTIPQGQPCNPNCPDSQCGPPGSTARLGQRRLFGLTAPAALVCAGDPPVCQAPDR